MKRWVSAVEKIEFEVLQIIDEEDIQYACRVAGLSLQMV